MRTRLLRSRIMRTRPLALLALFAALAAACSGGGTTGSFSIGLNRPDVVLCCRIDPFVTSDELRVNIERLGGHDAEITFELVGLPELVAHRFVPERAAGDLVILHLELPEDGHVPEDDYRIIVIAKDEGGTEASASFLLRVRAATVATR